MRRLSDQYPKVGPNWCLYKFDGRRERKTYVTDVRGMVEIISAKCTDAKFDDACGAYPVFSLP